MAVMRVNHSVIVGGVYASIWFLFAACTFNWSRDLAYSLGSNLDEMVLGRASALAYGILGVPGKSAAADVLRPYFWALAFGCPPLCFSYVLYKKPRLELLLACMFLHLSSVLMAAAAFAYVLWLPFALVGHYGTS